MIRNSISILAFCFYAILSFAQETINGNLFHNGVSRSYILYVPEMYSADSSVPLVFNFHGYTGNANGQMLYGDFRSIADTAGFLIVHPQGTKDNAGTTHFNVGWGGSAADDVGYTAALIDHISADYNIDASRIYSTGMSNGGFMSYQLACQLSDKIAAIASVTGSMSPFTFNNCKPQHPTPILQIHGTIDGVVPYNGSGFSKPIDQVMDYWINHNQCNKSPSIEVLPNVSVLDLSTVERSSYTGCKNGVSTVLLKIIGGGHTWAGTSFVAAGTNYDIDASLEIWKFFAQYDIAGKIDVTTNVPDAFEAIELKVFPNPVQSQLSIQIKTSQTIPYKLMSTDGQLLLSGDLHSNYHQVDLKERPAGLYLLQVGSKSYKVLKTH